MRPSALKRFKKLVEDELRREHGSTPVTTSTLRLCGNDVAYSTGAKISGQTRSLVQSIRGVKSNVLVLHPRIGGDRGDRTRLLNKNEVLS